MGTNTSEKTGNSHRVSQQLDQEIPKETIIGPRRQDQTNRLIKILVLVIASAIVLSSLWYLLFAARTIDQIAFVFDRDSFSFRRYKPGDSTLLEGTITGIERIDTTYGPLVTLELDEE